MLEDTLEKTFPGIRFSRKVKVEDARQKKRVLVQVPLMVRLAREGIVALGDVYSPCVALGSVPLPGRPSMTLDVLVLDADGGVAAVECRTASRGVHKDGAARLGKIHKKLRTLKSRHSLERIYRNMLGKTHAGEQLVDLAVSSWSEVSEVSAERAAEAWVENLTSGNVALYLATHRRATDRPTVKSDPITPMQNLLKDRAGGVLQVEPVATTSRPHKAFIEALEEPARLIWAYRRMVTS